MSELYTGYLPPVPMPNWRELNYDRKPEVKHKTGIDTLTLQDWAKRLDPEAKVEDISNLLSQAAEILQDMDERQILAHLSAWHWQQIFEKKFKYLDLP